MNLLVCTVGTHDLVLEGQVKARGHSERRWAEDVAAQYTTLRASLRLPIIAKALAYVQQRPGPLVAVVLIASDQQPVVPGADDYSATDTCVTAGIIARVLADASFGWHPLTAEQIRIWTVGDGLGEQRDPSDYDGVRRYLERRLSALHAEFPWAVAYLEVTGGTPAMSAGLLIAGTEAFGARAEVLYVSPRHPWPFTLNTGRRLAAGPLRAALASNIATYDYDAALRLLREQRAVVADRLAADAPALLDALLVYAGCRFNFDLPGARQALAGGQDRLGDGRWRAELARLYRAVDAPSRSDLLAEVYHAAAARFNAGNFLDFLPQVARFQENALRQLALERGARFVNYGGMVDPAGYYIGRAWADAQGVQFEYLPSGHAGNIAGNRRALRSLVTQLAAARAENLSAPLSSLDRLNALADLRNQVIHSFEGVDQAALARAFAGERAGPERAGEILAHMRRCYALVCGGDVGADPFDALNQLMIALLREAPG